MNENTKEYIKPAIILICIIIIPIILLLVLQDRDGTRGRVVKQYFEMKDYEINEVIPVYISDEEIAKKYYYEYMDLIINDPEAAYALVDVETLLEKFDGYKSFEKYINEQKKRLGFYNTTVKNYAREVVDKKVVYYVMDSIGNSYGFVETSIMNYTVRFI